MHRTALVCIRWCALRCDGLRCHRHPVPTTESEVGEWIQKVLLESNIRREGIYVNGVV